MNRIVTPTTIAPPAARYAHAVLVESTAAVLHTSGVVPTAPDGSVPASLAEQAEVVWENVTAILAEAEMSITDVVAMTTYVVAGNDLGPVMAARDRAFGDHIAASTLVTVPALARPAWLIEVAVIAAR